MTKYLPFYLDENKYLTNQKTFIVTGEDIGTLAAFCNSKLFKFAYSDNFPELQGGTRELSKIFFEKILVKKSNSTDELEYLELIKRIQEFKISNRKTSDMENELDEKMFHSYGLTDIEISAIEQAID